MLPIKLYSAPNGTGPNPWKVAFIFTELDIPYEFHWQRYGTLQQEPYISINPNGKVPSIEDPNTGVTVWESGACVLYLIETYDKYHELSYEDSKLKHLLNSWLFFQCSAQGPYFGQKFWFTHFHPERGLTTVIDRYGREVKRILGVIESCLRKQEIDHNSQWLVGNKCTYADLAFISWNNLLLRMFPEGFDIEAEFPLFYAWHGRMLQRPAVKKVEAEKAHYNATLDDSAHEVRRDYSGVFAKRRSGSS